MSSRLSMHRAALLIVLTAVAPALTLVQPLFGAPPASIDRLTSLTKAPSDAEKDKIGAFVEYWTKQLDSDDPGEVMAARTELLDPLKALGITRVFRQAYTQKLVPALQTVVRQRQRPMSAVNAMQVAARLGTNDAVDFISEHVNQADEDRPAVRLWAARGLLMAIQGGVAQGLLTNRQIAPALRDLGRAAESEDDWRVLQWQLAAISEVDHQISEEVLYKAFDSVMADMAKDDQATLAMWALRPALVSMRNRYLEADTRERGQAIARRLGAVLKVIADHEGAREDPQFSVPYDATLQICEQLLQVIDSNMGNAIGETTLKRAFAAGDVQDFDRQLQQIQGALQKPPYQ